MLQRDASHRAGTPCGVPQPPQSVRAQVAAATRADHENLHRHHVLEKLTASDITADAYLTILDRYLAFYHAAEKARQRFVDTSDLSLASEIACLEADLATHPRCLQVSLLMRTPNEILGMLYVLHGARFGARVIYRSLAKTLPNAPHHFFGQPTPRTTWQSLLRQMEARPQDRRAITEITSSAQITFRLFGRTMYGDPVACSVRRSA